MSNSEKLVELYESLDTNDKDEEAVDKLAIICQRILRGADKYWNDLEEIMESTRFINGISVADLLTRTWDGDYDYETNTITSSTYTFTATEISKQASKVSSSEELQSTIQNNYDEPEDSRDHSSSSKKRQCHNFAGRVEIFSNVHKEKKPKYTILKKKQKDRPSNLPRSASLNKSSRRAKVDSVINEQGSVTQNPPPISTQQSSSTFRKGQSNKGFTPRKNKERNFSATKEAALFTCRFCGSSYKSEPFYKNHLIAFHKA